jgi:DNA-binding NarL/FixJ family response regulator
MKNSYVLADRTREWDAMREINERDVIAPDQHWPAAADAPIPDAPKTLSAPSIPDKIVLVLSSRLFRDCLHRSLSTTTSYVIEDYDSLDDWAAADAPLPPRLVLLGLSGLSRDDGDDLIDFALAKANSVPVVVTSDYENTDYVYHVLSKGVRGFIPTSLALDVTIGALQVVKAGGVFAPASSLLAPRHSDEGDAPPRPLPFTAKQLAVIGAIRKGKANKTIAYELNMCESTVKVHVRNIMKKMNAKNRTEVAFIASSMLDGSVSGRT